MHESALAARAARLDEHRAAVEDGLAERIREFEHDAHAARRALAGASVVAVAARPAAGGSPPPPRRGSWGGRTGGAGADVPAPRRAQQMSLQSWRVGEGEDEGEGERRAAVPAATAVTTAHVTARAPQGPPSSSNSTQPQEERAEVGAPWRPSKIPNRFLKTGK